MEQTNLNKLLVINSLINDIPELFQYRSIESDDDLGIIFGNIGLFISEVIKKDNRLLINRCFNWINNQLKQESYPLDTLIRTEIFETLVDDDLTYNVSIGKLNNRGQQLIIKVYKFVREGIYPPVW